MVGRARLRRAIISYGVIGFRFSVFDGAQLRRFLGAAMIEAARPTLRPLGLAASPIGGERFLARLS
jgi:hypothetical protein